MSIESTSPTSGATVKESRVLEPAADRGAVAGEVEGSLWERIVALTIAVGERVLAPVERFIGKRSLVGDATFFPLERFPWVGELEANWTTIRAELEQVLEDHEALPNFQDISKDQIEITDDDHWKTFFLYGYGFEAKLGTELCPQTAALMRSIPGMTTAMFSILSPRKHILDHRGPYKGVLRYHLGLIVPQRRRGLQDPGRSRTSATGTRERAWCSTTRSTTRSGTKPMRRAWCCSSTCCARSRSPSR